MSESPVKQSLSQSPEAARQPAAIMSIVFYRTHSLSQGRYAVSVKYRKFSLPPLI